MADPKRSTDRYYRGERVPDFAVFDRSPQEKRLFFDILLILCDFCDMVSISKNGGFSNEY